MVFTFTWSAPVFVEKSVFDWALNNFVDTIDENEIPESFFEFLVSTIKNWAATSNIPDSHDGVQAILDWAYEFSQCHDPVTKAKYLLMELSDLNLWNNISTYGATYPAFDFQRESLPIDFALNALFDDEFGMENVEEFLAHFSAHFKNFGARVPSEDYLRTVYTKVRS